MLGAPSGARGDWGKAGCFYFKRGAKSTEKLMMSDECGVMNDE
jgi:hypothetical protein